MVRFKRFTGGGGIMDGVVGGGSPANIHVRFGLRELIYLYCRQERENQMAKEGKKERGIRRRGLF